MTREIMGEDVIGMPGQNLTTDELRVLVGLADGETPTQISRAVNADKIRLRHIESHIQGKLGARTKTHMIARGFVLGVLMTRALCLMLAVTAAINSGDNFQNRRHIRTRTNIVRLVRPARSGGGGSDNA